MPAAVPFKDVYFTGMVRDKQGRKMSKSLGNSPDLLELIKEYGADAVRFGIMISSPAGNDLLFDTASLEQGKFFNNKMWNALKLVKMWEQKISVDLPEQDTFATEWFASRLNEARQQVDKLIGEFRLSEALKVIYSLIWDDFCSWYLEWVKPDYEQPVAAAVYYKTSNFFSDLLQLLHPFMPFITEEINAAIGNQHPLCIKMITVEGTVDDNRLAEGELLKQIVTTIRDARTKNQLKPRQEIDLFVQTEKEKVYERIIPVLSKQVNATNVRLVKDPVPNCLNIVSGKDRLYIQAEITVDASAQKEQLMKDLEYQKGFLLSVDKKLGNERFVQNAKPAVVELEKKKRADAEAKIKAIEEALAQL